MDKIIITAELGDAILAHAQEAFPAECCGLVVATSAGPKYVPCRNDAAADLAQDHFVLHPDDWVAAEDSGTVLAVVHSHPNASANPTDADLAMCERTGLPWIIIGCPSGVITQTLPKGRRLPLVGRMFHHGVVDCYTLVQDYYHERLGIDLPDFERSDEWWKRGPNNEPGQNLYLRGLERAGFLVMGSPPDVEPQAHDMILMAILSDQPNHAAVMDGERPGLILHHLYDSLSKHDVWGGSYRRHATHVCRHRLVMERNHD
jgi:proteasome lid subunit RPN8/RPN11